MQTIESRRVLAALALSIASSAIAGCAAEAIDGEPAESHDEQSTELTAIRPVDAVLADRTVEADDEDAVTALATVTTTQQTRVTFFRTDDDDIGTLVLGRSDVRDSELEAAEAAGKGDPAAFYERLTGTTAPASLKTAASGVLRSRVIGSSDEGETESAPLAFALLGSAPAQANGSPLCNITNSTPAGSLPFVTCLPNVTGTPSIKKKVDHLSCRIDAPSGGPIRAVYRYKAGLKWHTPADYLLGAGEYMRYTGYYKHAQRWRECKTSSNPNNRQHHFRAVGHEYLSGLPFSPAPYVWFPSP